ncbi:hypothetical protein ACFTAO_12485 [Paenibacillus rhizoplanae]
MQRGGIRLVPVFLLLFQTASLWGGAVFFCVVEWCRVSWNRREEKGIVRDSCGLGRAADA